MGASVLPVQDDELASSLAGAWAKRGRMVPVSQLWVS